MKRAALLLIFLWPACGLADEWWEQMLARHNTERAAAKVGPLKLDRQLSQAAQMQADWMAANNKMSHFRAKGDKLYAPQDRILATGYWPAGGSENVAVGVNTVKEVMDGWMARDHRKNILDASFTEVGFGVTVKDGRVWWCVVFARK